jgi:Na+/H+ antiporter NhaC
MSLADTIEAWIDGLRALMEALVILMLSWTLAEITGALGTADYVVGLMNDTIPVELVPALTFLVAGLTALGTGTSWGTMAILMPLVVPVIWTMLGGAAGIDPSMMPIMFAGIASVLAGAVWGDHCSPISDTTILSSLATSCDHMAHVKTQMPYALLAGGAAMVLGLIPNAYGVPWWICLPVGTAALWFVLRRFGRTP